MKNEHALNPIEAESERTHLRRRGGFHSLMKLALAVCVSSIVVHWAGQRFAEIWPALADARWIHAFVGVLAAATIAAVLAAAARLGLGLRSS